MARQSSAAKGGSGSMSATDNRVLIVDDETVILDILEEHLGAKGFECAVANSASEALTRLRAVDTALLLTDIVMPQTSGIKLAQLAREISPEIAVIVMTGKSDTASAISAMRAGADDYILKPFDFEEMLICIERALDKRRLIIENRRYEQHLEERVKESTEDLESTNRTLLSTQRYLNNLIDSTADAIITIDTEEKLTFANRGAQHILGYSAEELVGKSIGDFYIGGLEEAKYIRRVTALNRPLQNYETEFKHKDGLTVPVSMSVSLVPAEGEEECAMLAICKDITEQKRLERELKEMTIRDGLTALYNLRHFYDRLEGEIERAKRQHHPLSLLLLDIDGFKSYNDSHGHLEGDRVLREVARVITDCTREHVDLGFRYGGDEFTIILPEAPEDQAHQIARRIRETFEAKHFDLLTISIGLMTYQEGQSARSFIQFTDSMMYDAKRSGGNQVHVYRPEEMSEQHSVDPTT